MQQSVQWHEDKIARAFNLDPHIFRALIQQESGDRQGARSPVGAIGRTQLMPATARGLGVNPYSTLGNIRGGAKYLAQQLHTFGGNYRKALAAYNAGPGAVQRFGGIPPYAETQNYVRTILGNAQGINVSNAGQRSAGGQRGGAGGRAGTGAGVDGGLTIPGVTGAENQPMGSTGILGLLDAMQARKSPVASVGLQAPQFAARPTLAGGMAPISSGAPAARPDQNALLDMIRTVGGDVAQAPGSPSTNVPGFNGPAVRTPGGSVAAPQVESAIQRATHFLGTSEIASSNRGKQVDKWERQFGMQGQAWCGLFLGNVLQHVGVRGIDARIASVAAIEQMAKAGKGGMAGWHSTRDARAGDLLVTSRGQHVALITAVHGDRLVTIAGNSGNRVQRVTYTKGSTYGVARPDYRR